MGSRTNGVRRASGGYPLPAPSSMGDFTSTSSPPISSNKSGRTPTVSQSLAKTESKIWEEKQKALKEDQVCQDKVWREFVEAEKRATKYWYQNWNFLKDYDPLGKKKEHEQLPDYVSVFSDKIPNTDSHIIGSRLNTELGTTLTEAMGSEGLLMDFANWTTILGCAVLKVPQAVRVVAAKSARGISLESLLLELGGFIICMRYMSYYNYPLLTYVEYPILVIQDIILLLIVLHYNGKMNHALPYTVGFVAGWYVLILDRWIIDLAMNLSTVVSTASKIAQLQCLWQTKEAGQVSVSTWAIAIYTCATRIFTTAMTSNDRAVLARLIVMLTLNIWVIATVLYYGKPTKPVQAKKTN